MSWKDEDEIEITQYVAPPHENKSYDPYSVDSTEQLHETYECIEEHEGQPPRDKFGIVYMIILLNGIGVLLPWNMFITIAPEYYNIYWFSPLGPNCTKTQDSYGKNFMTALGITSQIPNFLMGVVSVSQIIRGPILWRVMGSLILNCLLISVILILVIVQDPEPSAEHWFYIVSLIIVLVMNASNGLYQNSMFGLAADFPGRFINALVFGNNLCGTFTSVLAIVTTLAFPDNYKTVALLYFSISLGVVVCCLFSVIIVTRFDLYKYYIALGEAQRKAENTQRPGSFAEVWDMIVNQYWAAVKHCWVQFLNIFLTFFVSLAIFPTVLVGMPILPKYYKTDDQSKLTTFGSIYYDLAVFLNFNLMAAVGNFVAGFIQFPKKLLFIPVLLRLLFIPFFMLCRYDSEDDSRKMDIVFTSQWWWIIGNTVLSFTSGYFSSLGMMYAPSSAPPHLQKVAGQISALCLVGGIMAGVGFTPAITSMVEHIN